MLMPVAMIGLGSALFQAAAAARASVLFLLYVIGLQGLFRLYRLYIALSRDWTRCECVPVCMVEGRKGWGLQTATGAERVLEMGEM